MLDKVKELRDKTNAGVMNCKTALKEADGDIEKAIDILRKKGVSLASKKSSRATKEGTISSYIHMNSKIGVLLELNCETDFVARNEEFTKFAKELTMQIAAANPTYINKEEVTEEDVAREREIIKEQNKNKPEHALDKIMEGKLKSYYQNICLIEQPYIKDPKVSIRDLLTEVIAKTGENIAIKRFTRYQLGETA